MWKLIICVMMTIHYIQSLLSKSNVSMKDEHSVVTITSLPWYMTHPPATISYTYHISCNRSICTQTAVLWWAGPQGIPWWLVWVMLVCRYRGATLPQEVSLPGAQCHPILPTAKTWVSIIQILQLGAGHYKHQLRAWLIHFPTTATVLSILD